MRKCRRSLKKKKGCISGRNSIAESILHNISAKKRFKNGAINFSSQEVSFKLDEKGKPIGIIIKESKEAHQLIEEFMLLANSTVAEILSKLRLINKPIPFPYRIHDNPDEEKLITFCAFAKNLVISLIHHRLKR